MVAAAKISRSEKTRIKKILDLLDRYYPEAQCALEFKNPFQLLVATILSAQCTDVRVNQTTPALFKKYPGPVELAAAPLADLEAIIRPCGFYHNKALNLLAMSRSLAEKHGGLVPGNMAELIGLAGVGRKTANVVLGNAFGVPGLTVDTHLGRLSRRLGLSRHDDPAKVEADLAERVPKERWTLFSHQAIAHGRAVCKARKPLCGQCPLAGLCPSAGGGHGQPRVSAPSL